MKTLITQIKWQLVLLQKNNIITISFAVTIIYGLLLYFLKDVGNLDGLLVSLVLNDPSIIGYFFMGLAVYSEMKHQILPVIFTTPLSIHTFLISKTISISIIGVICSLGLAMSVKGLDFDILTFTAGSVGLCGLSTLLGIYMLTFANEFLKFAMISIPVFVPFINIPLLQYFGIIDLGFFKYLFPIQGSLDLIDTALSGTEISFLLSYASIITMLPLFYWLAFRQFSKKVVHQ